MNLITKTYKQILAHKLCLISMLILTIPAVIFHTSLMKGGERSWWYYSSNDACQGFAAQSISQRLGVPVENVVWPGATIPTPYLYAKLISAIPTTEGNVAATESLLAESVKFHWKLSAIYSVIFIWLFYLFVYRISGSNLFGLFSSIVVAINPFYAYQATCLRPEMLSMLWLFAAGHVAISKPSNAHALAQNLLFGLCVGLAVLSKIQILPALGCVVVLYLCKTWTIDSIPSDRRFYQKGLNITIALLTIVVSLGFIKSHLIAGTDFGLPGKPKTAGLIVFLCLASFLVFSIAMLFRKPNQLTRLFTRIVQIFGGGVLGLLVITFPNLVYGGVTSFIASINRILFGMASYAVYGLGLASGSGWGKANTYADKVEAFSNFQTSSYLLFVAENNLMLVSLIATFGLVLITELAIRLRTCDNVNRASFDQAVLLNKWAAIIIFIAVLVDFSMTNRTGGTEVKSVYPFYHIFTIPLYVLAVTLAFRSLTLSLSRTTSILVDQTAQIILAYTLALVTINYYPIVVPAMKGWKAAEGAPQTYTKQLAVIDGVSPSFFKRTNITLEALVTQVLSHTPPTSVPPTTPPTSSPLPVAKPPTAVPAATIPPTATSPKTPEKSKPS
jgi:hypothetical protein